MQQYWKHWRGWFYRQGPSILFPNGRTVKKQNVGWGVGGRLAMAIHKLDEWITGDNPNADTILGNAKLICNITLIFYYLYNLVIHKKICKYLKTIINCILLTFMYFVCFSSPFFPWNTTQKVYWALVPPLCENWSVSPVQIQHLKEFFFNTEFIL